MAKKIQGDLGKIDVKINMALAKNSNHVSFVGRV
jgi:hypothetical protein